jgi:hypothetical protein
MLLYYFYIFIGINNRISSESESHNYYEITEEKMNIIYIYKFLIFFVLIFNFIYYIVILEDINYLGIYLYKINYIASYVFLNLNFNKIIKYKYLENKNFYLVLAIYQILILFSFIASIIISFKLNLINILNVTNSNYIFINIILYIGEFYGIFAYMNNIILFLLIFIKLFQDIYLLYNQLSINIETNNKKGLIKFFHNIVNLKNIATYTISDFNFILNLFTIINLFSLGLVYHIYQNIDNNIKIYFYILVIYFIIIEIISLSVILLISHYRENILHRIYNPLFINHFIKRYDINTFNNTYELQIVINEENINNITLFNILEENSTSIDWIILNITLNSKWIDFDLFGIKIHSINSINQIIIIIALFYKIML